MNPRDMEQLLEGAHPDPFGVLGMHREGSGVAVRLLLPNARQVTVVDQQTHQQYPAGRVHPEGLFEAFCPNRAEPFAYELEVEDGEGRRQGQRDPYSFWPQLGSYDQYLFNEGTHLEAYEHLGAHLRRVDQVEGVYFAVWAPTARRVSVVGEFNRWDGRHHPMRSLGASGIWELFLPHLEEGTHYKYELLTAEGSLLLKADPYAFGSEAPPRSASVVRNAIFGWSDQEWMASRAQQQWWELPLCIYEVHLGSWRRVPGANHPLNYRDLAHQLVDYALEMGFTHLQLLPVAEHPFDGSWGYQVTGYFAPTARFGLPTDFAYFVDHCHRHGIGVIIDWVPGHFPSDGHGLATFDGSCLYEHADPRQGFHPDWNTHIFNFGRSEVRSFLLANALFWLDRYHVDGLRVDAVTSMLYLDYSRPQGQWVPNLHGGRENLEAIQLLRQLNTQVYARFPGALTIAEESTSWPAVSRPIHAGGLGFGFKWNMGWMNDVLRYMSKEPVFRKYHHSDLTFGMLYAYHENFVLPLSHDEVVHGKRSLLDKMPGDAWQKFANLRLLLGFMYGHPGKKLLFMGGEFGQWGEWNYQQSLDWHLLEEAPHRGVRSLVIDLNHLYRTHPALHRTDTDPQGFEWLDCQDIENSVYTFLRRDPHSDGLLVFAGNFTPVPREDYRVGVPQGGYYRELLNTDAALYGGSSCGNEGWLEADPIPWHGRPWSLVLRLPPLGMLVLQPQ
ncbi:MAG: 1,4-alpha-glucan branching protein GlgB [Candidatus Latescibacteria bacterium]|nr:1,4-alpha-glucan branching protein GlgB [Candidatus Latescibacterota bacterium]